MCVCEGEVCAGVCMCMYVRGSMCKCMYVCVCEGEVHTWMDTQVLMFIHQSDLKQPSCGCPAKPKQLFP